MRWLETEYFGILLVDRLVQFMNKVTIIVETFVIIFRFSFSYIILFYCSVSFLSFFSSSPSQSQWFSKLKKSAKFFCKSYNNWLAGLALGGIGGWLGFIFSLKLRKIVLRKQHFFYGSLAEFACHFCGRL